MGGARRAGRGAATHGRGGQRRYYAEKRVRARRQLELAHWTLLAASFLAIVMTALELSVVLQLFALPEEQATAFCGVCAVFLPVLAVAALSLAASHDTEARVHVYADMLEFVDGQVELLNHAQVRREYGALLLETESRLLGEVATWYSRRSFTGVP